MKSQLHQPTARQQSSPKSINTTCLLYDPRWQQVDHHQMGSLGLLLLKSQQLIGRGCHWSGEKHWRSKASDDAHAEWEKRRKTEAALQHQRECRSRKVIDQVKSGKWDVNNKIIHTKVILNSMFLQQLLTRCFCSRWCLSQSRLHHWM